MRIVLLYPPPWKMPASGETPDKTGEGPPSDWNPAYPLSGDIVHIPYGLLSLAAQVKAIGHEVKVFNLFTFAWRDVCEIIRKSPAELFGLTCFTSNRRGVLATAQLIRETRPDAHIAVGGPHASALPREMLEHCTAIDTIVIGEGEETFKELISQLEHNQSTSAIPSTAFRHQNAVKIAAPRKQIENIDSLIPVCRYFDDHIALTSRGCYARCTFCASPLLWGNNVRYHSPD